MKKLLAILLAAAVITASLTACGEGAASGADTTAGTEDPAADGVTAAQTHAVTLDNGNTVVINDDADAVLGKLGAHLDLMEAPSCVHEGTDRVYTYDGYTVTTSPRADGTQYVAELSLTSDVVALDNGIYLGCTLAEVKKAFGDDFTESFGVLKYELPGVVISVVADGDTVTGLTFSSAANQ